MKHHISEVFASFQGEGIETGIPTIFVRYFGCNLKCKGFNNPTNQEIMYDATGITLQNFVTPSMGCDTPYSWAPEYKHLKKVYSTHELAKEILRIRRKDLGATSWKHPGTGNDIQLCFTGGEPVLHQQAIRELLEHFDHVISDRLNRVTIETNGTRPLGVAFPVLVNFSVSPKLKSVSGELAGYNIDAIASYAISSYTRQIDVKFVADGGLEAWKEIFKVTAAIRMAVEQKCFENELAIPKVQFWIMPVGATVEQQSKISEICSQALTFGYRVSLRTHLYAFGATTGT